MNRTQLLNMLYRRTQTLRLAEDEVSFLMALAKPARYASGTATEVDGDALAILRKAGA